MSRGSMTFNFQYWCGFLNVPGIQSLSLWKSFWICSVYPQEMLVCSKKVKYSWDSVTFNFQNDVTPPVYAGQSLLNAKRLLGILVCMYKKGWVAWTGLVILNNEKPFWFRGVCDIWFSVLMWLCFCIWDSVSCIVKVFACKRLGSA